MKDTQTFRLGNAECIWPFLYIGAKTYDYRYMDPSTVFVGGYLSFYKTERSAFYMLAFYHWTIVPHLLLGGD